MSIEYIFERVDYKCFSIVINFWSIIFTFNYKNVGWVWVTGHEKIDFCVNLVREKYKIG